MSSVSGALGGIQHELDAVLRAVHLAHGGLGALHTVAGLDEWIARGGADRDAHRAEFPAFDFDCQFGIGEPGELRGALALCVAGCMCVRFGGRLFGFGAAVEIEQRVGHRTPVGEGAGGADLAHGA